MENKQEQIEKITIIVKHSCNKQGIAKHCPERISNSIYTEGYRKATEVIDEFVEKITYRFNQDRDSELYDKTEIISIINKIITEMRKELN